MAVCTTPRCGVDPAPIEFTITDDGAENIVNVKDGTIVRGVILGGVIWKVGDKVPFCRACARQIYAGRVPGGLY